jgi:hypothetical protein
MTGGKKAPLSREAVLSALSGLAPLDESLVSLLAVPAGLFETGPVSFSTEPDVAASSLEGCFYLGLPLPDRRPAYSISVTERGLRLFCTLVDARRKIIVNAAIGEAGDAEWESLGLGISMALDGAGKLEKAHHPFRYVLCDGESCRPV